MSVPASRAEFKEYCLRALGKPVLQINVDDGQAEDRIDEALYLYREYHMDAVLKDYLKHQITASTMVFSPAITGTFQNNELIVGNTSGAQGYVVEQLDANTISFFTSDPGLAFEDGDIVTGRNSGAVGTIATSNLTFNSVVPGDMDTHYIDISDDIISVVRVFPPYIQAGTADILFDPQNQFNMSIMTNFTNNSLIPYVMGRQYQALVSETLRGKPLMRFQRHMNRIYLDMSYIGNIRPGKWVIFEVYRTINEDTYTDIWSDRWLQRYSIALLKRQWGMNLSKFGGIALPGGVTLDGPRMLSEANQEVKDLEEELKTTYQLPIEFFVG
jgi:hypothetical protein